jgi:hypothetical protein
MKKRVKNAAASVSTFRLDFISILIFRRVIVDTSEVPVTFRSHGESISGSNEENMIDTFAT